MSAVPRIARATTEADFEHIRELMAEYVAWDTRRTADLGFDPKEFAAFYYAEGSGALPGIFAPPEGCLLLATLDGRAAGCGAYRCLAADACELKRMYVRPEFRGMRLGRRLADTLIACAREAGFRHMRLETASFMNEAQSLYGSLGFTTREPYVTIPENLKPITRFMELDLGR